jgi:predicted homoserine dehydrogenase-like protein
MLSQRLQELAAQDHPIEVGVIGAGVFGTQIIAQIGRMAGMRVAVVADLNAERAARALVLGGADPSRIRRADSVEAVERARQAREPAVTLEAEALLASGVDVVVEATGIPDAGGLHADSAIRHGKNLVMVTVEADVLVGYSLRQRAAEAGLLYSLAYGDEPALACELVDWARTLGFRVIAAGKGTRFKAAFREANPNDVPRLYGFTGTDYNAQVFCSFLDGTKHSIEMAALANATGLPPDVRGLHFPCVDLRQIPDVLCQARHGGILHDEGVVEAVSSIDAADHPVERSLRGGVFAVVAADDYVIDSLASYGEIIGMFIGKQSRHALIYRPQHMIGHEVPLGIARLMLYRHVAGAPVTRTAEVVSLAKAPLAPGTVLDGEGGFSLYGVIERAETARAENLLPVGLSRGAVLKRAKMPHDPITLDDVELPDTHLLRLWRAQENLQ